MKKFTFAAVAAVLALAVAAGCTKGYETKKTAGDITITLTAKSYPLTETGDNRVNIAVADASGKAITDATVEVRYFMPPMAGMAPMEYRTQAAPKGGAYACVLNTPMAGGWKVEVNVTPLGKPAATATFNLDAR